MAAVLGSDFAAMAAESGEAAAAGVAATAGWAVVAAGSAAAALGWEERARRGTCGDGRVWGGVRRPMAGEGHRGGVSQRGRCAHRIPHGER